MASSLCHSLLGPCSACSFLVRNAITKLLVNQYIKQEQCSILKCVFVVLVLCTANSYAQKSVINIVDSGRKTSIRGLSVVDDNIVWISGSNGTVARSVNGGKSFEWQTLAGYEKRDFRDIEAFDENTAVIMAVAEPAVILKTRDGGKSWNKVLKTARRVCFSMRWTLIQKVKV